MKNLYSQVDREIEKTINYDDEKEKKISWIKEKLSTETDDAKIVHLNDQLVDEYESYISDSALYYLNKNLQNPRVIANKRKSASLQIRKADIVAHAGLFDEAENILENVDRNALDSVLWQNYYSAYCGLYQYKIEYNNAGEFIPSMENARALYLDSVTKASGKDDFIFIVNDSAAKVRADSISEAEKELLQKIEEYKSGQRNYSILASLLAYVYKNKGDNENYQKWLLLSVISDIQGSVKENMAIRELATVCYDEGDLDRADRYLRKSFEDANFYAARMRNAQSSRMLPIIGEAFGNQQKKMNHELRLFVIFISILAFAFIISLIFALIQVRKVRANNKKTKEMLSNVSSLSEKLTELNKELSTANRELESSNAIKGEYGALFMEYCSLAISALQQYQQSLKVAATQGNMNNLVKKIESTNIENQTLAEFYAKFDEAVLKIYPHYVEKFNELLQPKNQIELNPKDGLNTELRVFALIKIGINDSEKISKFLRCSLTTVYTYRSKIKKKVLNPDTFEQDLMKI